VQSGDVATAHLADGQSDESTLGISSSKGPHDGDEASTSASTTAKGPRLKPIQHREVRAWGYLLSRQAACLIAECYRDSKLPMTRTTRYALNLALDIVIVSECLHFVL
jgi:hypothetical protein